MIILLFFRTPGCAIVRLLCPQQCICSMTTENSDHTIFITDCSNKNICQIPKNLPYNSTFTRLDGNKFEILANSTPSRHKVLFLNSSEIKAIHDGFFQAYPYLIILYLHDNKLTSLPDDIFIRLHSITTLSLHQNLLDKINLNILANTSSNIQTLSLSGNPWDCDCNFGESLKNWIGKNLEIVKNANNITCWNVTLPILQNSTLNITIDEDSTNNQNSTIDVSNYYHDINSNIEPAHTESIWKVDFAKCHEKTRKIVNPLYKEIILISSSLGVLFLILVAAGIVIFYYRKLILVWLYNNPNTNCFWRPNER